MSIHDPLYTWEDHEACWRMNYRGSLGNYVTNNYYHENADFFDKSIHKRIQTIQYCTESTNLKCINDFTNFMWI